MALKKMMSRYSVLVLLIIVGINGVWSISREEDLELERQLKILNKPGVKTIKTDNGEIFNCVDIHKQPSLDHPLLKNHEVQMTFNHPRKSVKEKKSPSVLGKGIGCPIGTVPIRRTKKEDLIRAQAFSKLRTRRYADAKNSHPLEEESNVFRSAKIYTNALSLERYYGIESYFNVYNPTLSSPDQSSTTLIYVAGGLDEAKCDISVGWTVNEPRYGDNQTHLFTYWTADGGATTGCYDLLCPGFIATHPHRTLGLTLPTSTYHGAQAEIQLTISKDEFTDHWWLIVDGQQFGYWPKQLFGIFGVARELYWGGEVFSPSQPLPPMGSGHFPEEGEGGACYMRALKYQYEDGGIFVDIQREGISRLVDNPECYKLGLLTNTIRGGSWGQTFFFGGPGGQC
ncbi:hypothetical protein PVL29_020376 [Vitis rotundifolia]|uniref:Neprosin PEP catalytic domain-containing protein n=1 Tax=Vitis rotundifolia TaxID=103349 RepID=A0AA38Z3M4_VITRO|nr:hypothetical protein PVL29_020376 [Vitis rotundifolia]